MKKMSPQKKCKILLYLLFPTTFVCCQEIEKTIRSEPNEERMSTFCKQQLSWWVSLVKRLSSRFKIQDFNHIVWLNDPSLFFVTSLSKDVVPFLSSFCPDVDPLLSPWYRRRQSLERGHHTHLAAYSRETLHAFLRFMTLSSLMTSCDEHLMLICNLILLHLVFAHLINERSDEGRPVIYIETLVDPDVVWSTLTITVVVLDSLFYSRPFQESSLNVFFSS